MDQLVIDDALNGQILRWNGTAWAVPGDSGWVNLTPAAGAGVARYRKIGNLVCVQFNLTGQTIPSSSSAVLLTASGAIPAGFRPAGSSYYTAANFSANLPGLLLVGTDGTPSALNNAGSSQATFRAFGTYTVD